MIFRFFIFLLPLAACQPSYDDPGQLVSEFASRMKAHQSVSYHIAYAAKFFSEEDTLLYPVDVRLIRDDTDSIFGGMVDYEVNSTDGVFRNVYDLDTIYHFVPAEGQITTFRPHLGEAWIVTGNAAGSSIETLFLNPEILVRRVNDKNNSVSLTTGKDGRYHLTIKEPDEEPFYGQERHYWFTPELVLNEISFQVGFQGNYQYNHWLLQAIEFDRFSKEDLALRLAEMRSSYPVVPYKPKMTETVLLAEGASAPQFSGRIYKSDEHWSFSGKLAKPLLVDFWYMSCLPCIESIPHLNEIKARYEDELIVMGINSIDNNEEDRSRLPNFLSKNQMDYDILLTEHTTDSLYRVSGYPTLYLIDTDGEVVFSQAGFHESLGDTLSRAIVRMLDR